MTKGGFVPGSHVEFWAVRLPFAKSLSPQAVWIMRFTTWRVIELASCCQLQQHVRRDWAGALRQQSKILLDAGNDSARARIWCWYDQQTAMPKELEAWCILREPVGHSALSRKRPLEGLCDPCSAILRVPFIGCSRDRQTVQSPILLK